MKTFNAACDTISREAYTSNTFNQYRLHHRIYHRVREQYKLPAQLVIRAISKVVESYKLDRRHLHVYRAYWAVVYDQRIMRFKGLDKISVTTAWGRETIPLMVGDYARLSKRELRGQADLVYVREFYLCLVLSSLRSHRYT